MPVFGGPKRFPISSATVSCSSATCGHVEIVFATYLSSLAPTSAVLSVEKNNVMFPLNEHIIGPRWAIRKKSEAKNFELVQEWKCVLNFHSFSSWYIFFVVLRFADFNIIFFLIAWNHSVREREREIISSKWIYRARNFPFANVLVAQYVIVYIISVSTLVAEANLQILSRWTLNSRKKGWEL